jgi:hypothetical protein
MEWEIPSSGGPLPLVLYPNRYLASASREEREILEAYGGRAAAFDRASLKRHGSLLITAANERSYQDSDCRAVLRGHGRPFEERLAALTYNTPETIAVFAPPARATDPSGGERGSRNVGCRTLRVSFRVHPPGSLGNDGASGEALGSGGTIMRLAGPIFPLARGTLHEVDVRFEGMSVTCAGCLAEGTSTRLRTVTFPPPLLATDAPAAFRVTFVRGVRLEFVGTPDPDIETHVSTTLGGVLDANPILRSQAQEASPGDPMRLRVHVGVLLKNLAARQFGEVQLGRGFLKVTPLFRKYHEASFLRALHQELAFSVLERAAPPRDVASLRALVSLSRMVSEERVARWFSSLDEIRAWSENLRFIPFFNDILQGKALVNNDVFLGVEERPNPVDTIPFDAVFPTFTGKELLERLNWCHGEPTTTAFRADSALLHEGDLDVAVFIGRWRALGTGRCAHPFGRYLVERAEPERIVVKHDGVEGDATRVAFQRSDTPQPPRTLFSAPGDEPLRDTVLFKVEAGQGDQTRRYETSSSRGGEKRVVVADASDGLRARVEGPNTEGNKDMQVLPRRLDFLLTGVKLRYDSRVGGVEGEQGVQWRMRGDEYGRAFTLMVKREESAFLFEPVFSMNLGGEPPPGPEPTVDEETLLSYPRVFPASLGLSSEIARDTELWAVATVGARAVTGSVIVPSGFETKFTLKQSLMRAREKTQGLKAEAQAGLYLPLARLTTGVLSLRVGQSTEPEKIGGPGNVPGVPADALVAKRYVILKHEVRYALAYNLKWNLLSTILFEDVVLYGAHNAAVDSQRLDLSSPAVDAVQGLQFGVQFYGAFFGAKNQSISAEVARGLEEDPRNVYSLTVGRNM